VTAPALAGGTVKDMSMISLPDPGDLDAVLAATPNGKVARDVAEQLGVWTTGLHSKGVRRRALRSELSKLGPDQLSDEFGWWSSEFGRVCELAGVLAGQREMARLAAKQARAAARSRVRERLAESKPTAGQVNDLAEEDNAVSDADAQLVLIETLEKLVGAAKEATDRYLQTLSREVAFRDAQMKARLYG
jgi:hypothetical protein